MAGALDGSSIRSDIIGRLASRWRKVRDGRCPTFVRGTRQKKNPGLEKLETQGTQRLSVREDLRGPTYTLRLMMQMQCST